MATEPKIVTQPSVEVQKLVAQSSEVTKARFRKQEEFTRDEASGLAFWLQAVLERRLEQAVKIRDAFLRAEHWRSLLSDDLKDAGEDELKILAQLRKEFEAAIKGFTRPTPQPQERPSPRER